jgi:hypothetical protein
VTERHASGIRKVFKLKPGEEHRGSIRLSAGIERDERRAALPQEQRDGSFENQASHKGHVLSKDARTYTAELRYQVKSHRA